MKFLSYLACISGATFMIANMPDWAAVAFLAAIYYRLDAYADKMEEK